MEGGWKIKDGKCKEGLDDPKCNKKYMDFRRNINAEFAVNVFIKHVVQDWGNIIKVKMKMVLGPICQDCWFRLSWDVRL